VEPMSTGAFARVSGLSRKALRLYDELGLLRPAAVDERTGYRWYTADQVDRARLVAWLRRLGMPLARIATVVAVDPAAAAAEIRAYRAEIERETALRRALATLLADHLSREDEIMTAPTFVLHAAAASDRGLVREAHQDLAHADAGLLLVADGFGPIGADMSRVTVDAVLAHRPGSGEVLAALRSAVDAAVSGVEELPAGDGSGCTLTALALSGDRLALVHVGDGRVYLLRDGVLTRLTDDHTVAWPLLEGGSLTEDELASHPERALLTQALTPGLLPRPDALVREVRAGDRYLVSSDGLHAVLPRAEILAVLRDVPDPTAAVAELVRRVLTAGAPDNVACAVGDVAAVG